MDNAFCFGALHTVGVHMAHDIVAHLFFARLGDFIVNVVGVGFEFGDLLVGNRQPQFFFAFGKGNPQLSPSAEFKVRRKDVFHFFARIARVQRAFVNVFHRSVYLRGDFLVLCVFLSRIVFDIFPRAPEFRFVAKNTVIKALLPH